MANINRTSARRWASVAVTLVLLAVVGWLTRRALQDMDWGEVHAQLASYSVTTLGMALLAALAGYTAVSHYDLVGRHHTGHSLPVRRVMTISFIGYTFSLNLGGFIGGVAFRFRLYTNAGLALPVATQVIGLSILGNWSGFVLLGGLLFTFAPVPLPESWGISPTLLRALGLVLLAATITYVWLCWRHAGRTWKFGRYTVEMPALSVAATLLALSLVSWCAIATIISVLLPDKVNWLMVLAVLLTSVVAALLAHIPGGIGVIELVFITLLGHLVPESSIVAALLSYRCIYYLLPLLMAVLLYVATEIRHARATTGGGKASRTA